MRLFPRFLAFTLGLALLSVPGPAQAFATPNDFICGAVKPVDDHCNIRMELMRVVVRLGSGLFTFDSEFRLYNPGPTVTMRVEHPDMGNPGGEDVFGFTASVNGKRRDVTKKECDNEVEKIMPDGSVKWNLYLRYPDINCGFTHKVTFAGQSVTTIGARYSSRGPAVYLLGPATYWKGPIAKTVVIVDCSDVGGTKSIKRLKEPIPRQQLLGDNLLKYEFGPSNPCDEWKLGIACKAPVAHFGPGPRPLSRARPRNHTENQQ